MVYHSQLYCTCREWTVVGFLVDRTLLLNKNQKYWGGGEHYINNTWVEVQIRDGRYKNGVCDMAVVGNSV